MKSHYLYLAALTLAVVSCKRETQDIKVYQVANEPAPAAAADPHAGMGGMTPGAADPHAGVPGMGGMMPGAADPHAGVPGMGGGAPAMQVADAPPAHWEKRPGGGMRLVTYVINGEGEEVAVAYLSSLRAAPGSLLNAVNLWRDQLGQPVADEAAVKQYPTTKTTFGDGVVVDIEGSRPADKAATPGRLIGVIAESEGIAWYFKMDGTAALAAKERDNFIQWVATVKVSPAPPAPTGNSNQPEAKTPSPVPDDDGRVTWTVPEGWTQAPKGGMGGYASFIVKDADGGEARIAVSHFPGDVGGDLANVNRWRGQVGMAPVKPEELAALVTKVSAGPKTLQLVDCGGMQLRCTAAWVRHGADTWFFKFTGPDALVGAGKAKFAAFLESIRFTTPE
ncbi:MAG: hypothetical protein K9N23_03385 [Akkermansiaceae bacterium]|nr:hypothetical protein [Akkermansiaceae bacterium]